MNFARLEYFLAAAHCLNFTKAANLVCITQPSLSKQIAILESEIGVKLFDRSNRALRLTPAGKFMLGECENILTNLDEIVEQTRLIGRQSRDSFSIGCIESIYIGETAEKILKKFTGRFSKIDMFLERCNFEELRTKLLEGTIDIAFTLSFHLQKMKDLSYVELEERSSQLTISVDHPLAQKEAISFQDLKGETILFLEEAKQLNLHQDILDKCESVGFTPDIRYVPTNETVLSYLDLNMGVTFYDKSVGINRIGRLKFFPTSLGADFSLVCVWMKKNPNPLVRDFIKMLPKSCQIKTSK